MRRLAAAALVVVAGCKTVAHGEIYEESIRTWLHDHGEPTADVRCPARIPLGVLADDKFECVLIKDGRETPIEVQLTSNENPLLWKVQSI